MKPFKFLSFKKNCTISESSKIYPFSIISNSQIGEFTYVSYSCKINNTSVGKFCSIAQNVKMGLGKHPLNFISTSPIFYSKKNPLEQIFIKKDQFNEHESITIGNDVWIGTNVTIIDGVSIGDGAIIGAHSLVTKNIEPYSIVGGVPAKEIKKRFSTDIIVTLLELKWWDYPIEKIKKPSMLKLFSKDVDIKIINELAKRLNKNEDLHNYSDI